MNDDIRDIPIDQIVVLNPRSRNKRMFMTIVANIEHLGLKRPITVTPSADGKYDLVCGQGRLEAYQALGATTIPGIIINATREDRYLMSLVENIARRRHKAPELLKEITTLSSRGYSTEQVSTKLDLDRPYVHSIMHLLAHGEERLIDAVERRILPLSVGEWGGHMLMDCDDPLTIHKFCSMLPSFVFEVHPVITVEDAVRGELEVIAWRDGLKGK